MKREILIFLTIYSLFMSILLVKFISSIDCLLECSHEWTELLLMAHSRPQKGKVRTIHNCPLASLFIPSLCRISIVLKTKK